MNSVIQIAVVAVLVIAALAFIVVRLVKTIKGKQPSCCGDSSAPGNANSPCTNCPGCSSHK